jgi:hypothetical protein
LASRSSPNIPFLTLVACCLFQHFEKQSNAFVSMQLLWLYVKSLK